METVVATCGLEACEFLVWLRPNLWDVDSGIYPLFQVLDNGTVGDAKKLLYVALA